MQKNSKYFQVEVAYARSNIFTEQEIVQIILDQQLNVEEVIKRSGILNKFPEIDLSKNKVGIFGKIIQLADLIKDGDRIEIYQDLLLNPNIIRQSKVAIEK